MELRRAQFTTLSSEAKQDALILEEVFVLPRKLERYDLCKFDGHISILPVRASALQMEMGGRRNGQTQSAQRNGVHSEHREFGKLGKAQKAPHRMPSHPSPFAVSLCPLCSSVSLFKHLPFDSITPA